MTTPKTTKNAAAAIPADDFKNLCDLLSVFSAGTARLKEMEGEMNALLLDLVDDKRAEYAELQQCVTQAETALEIIARAHPEWFTDKKTVKTPFGTVKFHKSTKLEIKNAELTIALVRSELARGSADPAGVEAAYIKQEDTLDVEALEKLDDDTLKRLKVKRVASDNFSAQAASVDLGKAVKEAAEKGSEVAA